MPQKTKAAKKTSAAGSGVKTQKTRHHCCNKYVHQKTLELLQLLRLVILNHIQMTRKKKFRKKKELNTKKEKSAAELKAKKQRLVKRKNK